MTTVKVKQLFVHPVKGLTPQAVNSVNLQAGHGILCDRAFALMLESLAAENASPIVPWMKKHIYG